MQTTEYKCPFCGEEGEVDHNSFRCHKCQKLWPLSYFKSTQETVDRETIYGKSPLNPLIQIAMKAYKWIEGLAEGAHTYAAVLGLVVMLMLGFASVGGVPIYLRAGEGEPTELLFSPTMGWVMISVALLGFLGYCIVFVKLTVKMIKKRRGARKVKNNGLSKLY